MKSAMRATKFALCVRNDGADDIEPRKVYEVLPDRTARREGYMRIRDESGEDYLYPADMFVPLKLPAPVTQQLTTPTRPHRVPGRRLRGTDSAMKPEEDRRI